MFTQKAFSTWQGKEELVMQRTQVDLHKMPNKLAPLCQVQLHQAEAHQLQHTVSYYLALLP
jgi:hypothetical protein